MLVMQQINVISHSPYWKQACIEAIIFSVEEKDTKLTQSSEREREREREREKRERQR